MHNLQVESHITSKGRLPHALAMHILTAYLDGGVAVVCDAPRKLMSQVKKECGHLFLVEDLRYRRPPSFSAASLFDDVQANIVFATVRECKLLPPICDTLYIVCQVDQQDMYMITSWMRPRSKVVIYESI